MRKDIKNFAIFILLGAIINFTIMGSLSFFPTDWWDTAIYLTMDEEDEIKARLPEFVFADEDVFHIREHWNKKRWHEYYYVSGTEVNDKGGSSNVTLYLLCNSGWPMFSFEGTYFKTANGMETSFMLVVPASLRGYIENYYIPLKPKWPGFVVNTALFGGVPWLLICGPFVLRRHQRRKRKQCVACGYPIGKSDVCTECGLAIKPVASNVTK